MANGHRKPRPQRDRRVAADLLNINQINVAVVQHELGVFCRPAAIIREPGGIRRRPVVMSPRRAGPLAHVCGIA